ncbi:hypothetical protein Tam10B_0310 [Bifidobacterium vansinderenii]|uniref:Lipoprotein n=2 Tax=Bifidobacterium vansinderenii TaxID=1984871 RepID=A0A229W0A1_9BIFI|nr:hypothetical protein Tam10B_0310 [Bifidobacterium vansinderenii]
MRHCSALISIGICIALLSGCGNSQQQDEQFIEGGESSKSDYQTIVNEIMSDKKVTTAEAQQSAESYVQCLTEAGLSGKYHYDPATDYWILIGDGEISYDSPDFRYMDLDPSTAAGKKLSEKIQATYSKKKGSCDAVFNPISTYLESHADWDSLAKNQYEATVDCIIGRVPSLNNAIDDSWPHDSDGLSKLSELISSHEKDLSSEDQTALTNCQTYYTTAPETFGVASKPLDQLTEQERKELIAKGQLSEQSQ